MRSLPALLASATLLTLACASSPAAPTLRGTYEAESGGDILWITFSDPSHYRLLLSGNCSLAAGASSPCIESGTYVATTSTVALTNAATGTTKSYPLAVVTTAGNATTQALSPGEALHVQGGGTLGGDDAGVGLGGSDDAGGTSLGGSTAVGLTDPDLATALTLGGSPVSLVDTSDAQGASGYLVAGASKSAIGPNVLCGATLLAPTVVLTAAHCADKMPAGSTWAFGLGDVGGTLYYASTSGSTFHNHPAYVDAAQGGIAAKLRENDLAYLILETAAPASAPSVAPMLSRDCGGTPSETAVVYRPARQLDDACIELALTLQAGSPDPIYEVHPVGDGLCPASGDDGSALYSGGALVGTFAGSITGALQACTQYLNGYESATGHQSFIDTATAAGGG